MVDEWWRVKLSVFVLHREIESKKNSRVKKAVRVKTPSATPSGGSVSPLTSTVRYTIVWVQTERVTYFAVVGFFFLPICVVLSVSADSVSHLSLTLAQITFFPAETLILRHLLLIHIRPSFSLLETARSAHSRQLLCRHVWLAARSDS